MGGWSWFTWNIQTARYVLKYLDEHPEFYKRFNHTYCGDELIFQTILKPVMNKLKIDGEHPLRFVSWKPRRPIESPYRPYTLNELDYDYVINSAAFFCRKVDLPESSKLLDMIDEQRGNEFDVWKAERIL